MPSFNRTVLRGKERIDIVVHPCPDAGAVIINCPGHRGDISGYNNKYVTLADHLVAEGLGTVIRMPNIERPGTQYGPELVADIRAVIEYALKHTGEIGAVSDADFFLMGFSAGGFAVAAVAAEYPQVKKILLMEPTISTTLMGPFPDTFQKFEGEVAIVVGDHDAVGPEGGKFYYNAFSNAFQRQMVTVPNCNHQFMGRVNGQIMAKAPIWAFLGDPTYPSPDGGIVLY